MKEIAFIILLILCVAPILVYFCVKFGTLAYYKAREFMEKEKQ